MRKLTLFVACSLLSLSSLASISAADESNQARSDNSLTLVVMDPLAAPLSCPCVEGYAQREYEALESYLEDKLSREVSLHFTASLSTLKKEDLGGKQIDIIIGKDSVVRHDAKQAGFEVAPIGRLSDKSGSTTQYGMIVVPKDDKAQSPSDLSGYKIFFGSIDSQEKHQAAVELLTKAGVTLPEKLEVTSACSDGACKILEFDGDSAAVISSYAAPLLEGCGTIKKGDLRVIGKTKEVPFVTAFTNSQISPEDQAELKMALMNASSNRELCGKLESLLGFLPVESAEETKKK